MIFIVFKIYLAVFYGPRHSLSKFLSNREFVRDLKKENAD